MLYTVYYTVYNIQYLRHLKLRFTKGHIQNSFN